MTRRERIEARLERRREWAESRERKAAEGFERARRIADNIPLGQPILVGHHSEGRHRRDIAKIDAGMRAGVESSKMAAHHSSKAAGLEHQLATSIYSDDADALEALEAKAAKLDAEAEREVAINKAWRKHKGDAAALLAAWGELGVSPALAESLAARAREYSWLERRGPCDPSYNRANARRARERIEEVKRRNARQARAEAAGGLSITRGAHDNCQVIFAEKPERSIIDALKGAGFHWSGGSWFGSTSKLPATVLELEQSQVKP